MILLIDNYDSFVYNLYQLIGSVCPDIKVTRNDKITISEIEQLYPEAIVISPGPGKPKDAGICIQATQHFAGKIPILGVCLGHQAICEAFGGTVSYAKQLMHGKTSELTPEPDNVLFQGIQTPFTVARYHSLSVCQLPDQLKVTARSTDGEIMAVEHRNDPIFGVQFHPESVMTPSGQKMIQNFFDTIRR